MSTPDVTVGVAIVGAGPHGLAVALHLLDRDPTLRDDLVVLDPEGWMGRWNDQFARLDIAHLRSPAVHHPGCAPGGLSAWSRAAGLRNERPYGIPSTEAMRAYCELLVERAGLTEHVVPTHAHRLVEGPSRTVLELGDGTVLGARHVVLAVNPARRRLPHWVFDPLPVHPDRLAHADDVDLRGLDLTGEHVVVVGGGLTAGHLVVGAVARGARATLVARRSLRTSMFDTDPGWLGPKRLDGFAATTDPTQRLGACLGARDGGSLPPWMAQRLATLRTAGTLEVVAPARVCGARSVGSAIELSLGDETTVCGDRVWLATGTATDVAAHRLTGALLASHPSPVLDGWPVLDGALRWPGTRVHLVGRPAMLSLGPAAGNLWGARVGAVVVADHVVGCGRRAQNSGAAAGTRPVSMAATSTS